MERDQTMLLKSRKRGSVPNGAYLSGSPLNAGWMRHAVCAVIHRMCRKAHNIAIFREYNLKNPVPQVAPTSSCDSSSSMDQPASCGITSRLAASSFCGVPVFFRRRVNVAFTRFDFMKYRDQIMV